MTTTIVDRTVESPGSKSSEEIPVGTWFHSTELKTLRYKYALHGYIIYWKNGDINVATYIPGAIFPHYIPVDVTLTVESQ